MAKPTVYHIWIIKRPSGLCVVDAKLRDIPNGKVDNGAIIGGLLTSYLAFTEKMVNEPIKLLETNSFKILFFPEEQLITALLVDSKIPTGSVKLVAGKIKDYTIKRYPQILDEDFDGDTSIYDDITKNLEMFADLKGIKLAKFIRSKQIEAKNDEKLRHFKETLENL